MAGAAAGGPQYRFRAGELRPATVRNPPQPMRDPWAELQQAPGVLTDRINVAGNEPSPVSPPPADERRISTGATVSAAELARIPTARDPWKALQQGLVGGVKPLPVAIPESGKVLYLTGVLPPVRVGVELEVKGKR
jgi:hypothetical protein